MNEHEEAVIQGRPFCIYHVGYTKNCIVVEIPAGYQKLYYIKSLGIQKGVYVRVGATT